MPRHPRARSAVRRGHRPAVPHPSALLALAVLCAPGGAHAQSAPTVEDLARRLQAIEARLGAPQEAAEPGADLAALDRRLRAVERTLGLQAEEASAKAASATRVGLSASKGLSVRSPAQDGAELKLRGLLQADGRFFFDDAQRPQNDTFLWRRAQLTLEGTWGPLLGFRVTPELAGDSVTLLDAWVDLKFDPRATVRIGKSKNPVGLERLQNSGATALVELGFPGELAPGRDIGVQLQGELASSTVSYALGAYNGAPDGRDGATANPDDDLELAARVFVEPWKNTGSALSGLGFGLAGSRGGKHGNGNAFLPRYRTPGQATFFAYRGAVDADGTHARWSPQAYFYRHAFGLLGEYIRSEQEVALPAGGARASLAHDAWQLTASYVLTGEDAGYRGVARPNRPFTPGGAGWGAWELVARYGELDVDDAAFPSFADPASAASRAAAWTLGVNWYLNGNFKLVANYSQTRFDGGAADGADREDEKAFLARAQFSF